MKLRKLLLLPAVIIGLLAPYVIPMVTGPTAQASTTADVVIGVDGTGSVTDMRSIVKTRAGMGALIVQYPGEIFPIGVHTYDQSVRLGINETKRLIRQVRAENPAATVHLIGHSQGSRVAGDAISELAAEGMDLGFLSAELLSDPRHPASGIENALSWMQVPGYTMNGERGSFGNAQVRQVCVPGDPICDWPSSWLALHRVPVDFVRLHGNY